jgi:hypothetical protein
MRWIRPALLFVVVGGISLDAQTVSPPPPQSARQALLEMLFGKGENDFQKHLPEDASDTHSQRRNSGDFDGSTHLHHQPPNGSPGPEGRNLRHWLHFFERGDE